MEKLKFERQFMINRTTGFRLTCNMEEMRLVLMTCGEHKNPTWKIL